MTQEMINGVQVVRWLVPGQFMLAVGKYNPEMLEILEVAPHSGMKSGVSFEFCFTAHTLAQLCDWIPDLITDTRPLEKDGEPTKWAALGNALRYFGK